MHSVDFLPLSLALIVFSASIISLRLGISVAIVEIILGLVAGNYFHFQPREWMIFIANFGGVFLTFLAGAEIDENLIKEKLKPSLLMGFFSFITPFVLVFLFSIYVLKWPLHSSLISAVAMSDTSLAVVYSILIEFNLAKTDVGKLLLCITFMVGVQIAVVLSVICAKPDMGFFLSLGLSLLLIILARMFSVRVFLNRKLKDKVIEPEIKYIFLLILILMFLAKAGGTHAVLPAFIMGLLLSRHFRSRSISAQVKIRLRTVAYSVITPFFFIVSGMRVSISMMLPHIGLFGILFGIRILAKSAGVYFFTKTFVPENRVFVTLISSTGLAFGIIACAFGLSSGFIDQHQYSLLVSVIIASSILPTLIAQKFFFPKTA